MAYTQDTQPDNHRAPGAPGAHASPALAEAISIGYEPHDVGLRGVFIFIISLIVVTLVVLGVVWVILMAFVNYSRSKDPIASPVVIEHPVPPQPLQPSWNHNTVDRQDMADMRRQTSEVLNSTGTSPTGRRYISIDAAMEQVLPQLPIHAAVQPGNGAASQ